MFDQCGLECKLSGVGLYAAVSQASRLFSDLTARACLTSAPRLPGIQSAASTRGSMRSSECPGKSHRSATAWFGLQGQSHGTGTPGARTVGRQAAGMPQSGCIKRLLLGRSAHLPVYVWVEDLGVVPDCRQGGCSCIVRHPIFKYSGRSHLHVIAHLRVPPAGTALAPRWPAQRCHPRRECRWGPAQVRRQGIPLWTNKAAAGPAILACGGCTHALIRARHWKMLLSSGQSSMPVASLLRVDSLSSWHRWYGESTEVRE